ncbi:MAG: EF-P beta-lysylation protein EpmB [Legionellaceae bacterium]
MREPNVRWQAVLAAGFTSAAELLTFLNLPVQKGSAAAEQQFKTRVPRGFALRMEKENPYDPLLLQVLAVEEELVSWDGYVQDPLIEAEKNPHPGLLHKYAGRVLLMMTGACAVNCRYCFRRHFPYEENQAGHHAWHDVLLYIAGDPSIHEVILSGGDPLLANDKTLASLIDALGAIDHVQTLRFHTRIPVVLPERVDEGLLQVLTRSRLHCVVVLHVNHPNELNEDVDRACAALKKIGVYLLNQSVVLKGVNDDPQTLVALSQRLFQSGVLPYYLHVLDKVQGAAHFDVSDEHALRLFSEVQASLPGYLVPRLVREIPGALSKRLVGF